MIEHEQAKALRYCAARGACDFDGDRDFAAIMKLHTQVLAFALVRAQIR